VTPEAITNRSAEQMDHRELRNEWSDVVDQLYRGPTPTEHERLYERRHELWNEMKSRVDAEPPECPECGGQSWSQTRGEPKVCTDCDLHLAEDHVDLIQEIDAYWRTVKAGGSNDGE